MKKRHLVPVVAALAGALAVPAAVAAPAATRSSAGSTASATTATAPLGTRSLAAVLTADGNRFDRNWHDYDIVTEAVLAVLAAKPTSPVGLLTKGNVPLTAFIPDDRAFQVLAADLTGRWYGKESQVFDGAQERRRHRRPRVRPALPRGSRRPHHLARPPCGPTARPSRRPFPARASRSTSCPAGSS